MINQIIKQLPVGNLHKPKCISILLIINEKVILKVVSANIPDNIIMLHLFQKRNLSNSSAWDTLIILLKPNLLQRNSFISHTITSFVDHSICSFTNFLNFFILKFIQMSVFSASSQKETYTKRYNLST